MYNNDYLEPEYDQYQEEEYQDYNYYPTNTMPDVIKEFLVYFSQSVEKGKKNFFFRACGFTSFISFSHARCGLRDPKLV